VHEGAHHLLLKVFCQGFLQAYPLISITSKVFLKALVFQI